MTALLTGAARTLECNVWCSEGAWLAENCLDNFVPMTVCGSAQVQVVKLLNFNFEDVLIVWFEVVNSFGREAWMREAASI